MTHRPKYLSLFRYPGGKYWLAPMLAERIQGKNIDRWVEPFAGGGAVGLYLLSRKLVNRLTFYEIDPAVAAVWQLVLRGSDNDISTLKTRLVTFTPTWQSVLTALDGPSGSTLDSAFKTLLMNRVKYMGMMTSAAGIVRRGEANKGLSSRWIPHALCVRINWIRSHRDKITFHQDCGLFALPRYLGDSATHIFADPPYYELRKKYRKYTHDKIDHKHLLMTLAPARNWTLTNSLSTLQLAQKYGYETHYLNRPKGKTELLISPRKSGGVD